MTKFTKTLLLLIVAFSSNLMLAQLSVTGQVSGLKFMGDVGKKGNANYFSDMRLGYGLGVEYRIGKILGVGLDGLYGKLAGTDNDKTSHANFQSTIMGGALNITAYFDKIGNKNRQVSPFVNAGIGYLMFDSYGDLKNKKDSTYYYWADGSIKDLPESVVTPSLATTIRRDYTYETQYSKDTTGKAYSKSSIYIPVGLGLKFNVGYRAAIRIGATYNLMLSDWIDNKKQGGGDSWLAANIGLNVHFGKKPKDAFSGVDFDAVDNSDTDGDGVKDNIDKCLGTPKGIKVDAKGCPDDKDEDGVFDYMDKELTTKKGAKVDGDGITIDEAELAKRQLQWDSLATARSNEFNDNPSQAYLDGISNKVENNAAKSGGGNSKIPAEFQAADYDGDGIISAKEITKTIDGFFEGESSFTVEKINKLIDFFFEQ